MSCAGNCYRANVSSYQPRVGCAGSAGSRDGGACVWGEEKGGIAPVPGRDAEELGPFLN